MAPVVLPIAILLTDVALVASPKVTPPVVLFAPLSMTSFVDIPSVLTANEFVLSRLTLPPSPIPTVFAGLVPLAQVIAETPFRPIITLLVLQALLFRTVTACFNAREIPPLLLPPVFLLVARLKLFAFAVVEIPLTVLCNRVLAVVCAFLQPDRLYPAPERFATQQFPLGPVLLLPRRLTARPSVLPLRLANVTAPTLARSEPSVQAKPALPRARTTPLFVTKLIPAFVATDRVAASLPPRLALAPDDRVA